MYFLYVQELFSIADEICLQVPDMDVLIDKLNVAGYLLKKGHRQYQVSIISTEPLSKQTVDTEMACSM